MAGFWWECFSWLQTADFSLCPHMAESREGKQALCDSCKGTHPIPEVSTLMTFSNLNYLHRPHLLIPSHLGLVFQNLSLEGTQTLRPYTYVYMGLWAIFWVNFSIYTIFSLLIQSSILYRFEFISLLWVELCPSEKICWSSNPQYLRTLPLEIGSLQG